MKTKTKYILAALSILTAALIFLWAGHRHTPASTAQMLCRSWGDKLNLDKEQLSKFAPLQEKLQSELAPVQSQLAQERIKLCSILASSAAPAMKEILPVMQKINALEMKQQLKVVEHLLGLRTVLTPEQNKKLAGILAKEICKHCASGRCNHMHPD